MPTTYDSIASYTSPNSSENTVTFNNIPSSYSDLILVVQAGSMSSGINLEVRYNNDSGTNYKWQRIRSSSSATDALTEGNATAGALTAMDHTGTLNAQWVININGYSNTTWYKHTLWDGGFAGVNHGEGGFLWLNSAAISRIDVSPEWVVNFRIGSTFALYGLLKA